MSQESSELTTRLSDLSGPLSSKSYFESYLTLYPLLQDGFYVIAKTWPDNRAPRAGCVLTQTLLLPADDWATAPNPHEYVCLFRKPLDIENLDSYRNVLQHRDCPPEHRHIKEPRHEVTLEFVSRYFGEGLRPIIWFGEDSPEELLWPIVSALWPKLRKHFACCTFSLQPRALEDRPFDLMFAPRSAYSRFRSFPRECILDFPISRRLDKEPDSWLKEWAGAVFSTQCTTKPMSRVFPELWKLLDDDPTAIRKLFLVRDLEERSNDSLSAILGLMDVVTSLAPDSKDLIEYKTDLAHLALSAVSPDQEIPEVLKYYFAIDERLGRSAFSQISTILFDKLRFAVASLTKRDTALVLDFGSRILAYADFRLTPFKEGILIGLEDVSSDHPARLSILRSYPSIASLVLSEKPQVGMNYLHASKDPEETRVAADDLCSWIASVEDPSMKQRIRNCLLQEVGCHFDYDLVHHLLKDVREDDVPSIVSILSESPLGFQWAKLIRIFAHMVSRRYPEAVRESSKTIKQTKYYAAFFASTFTCDADGLSSILSFDMQPEYKGPVVASFLELSYDTHFPLWLRDYAEDNADFLVAMLMSDKCMLRDVSNMIQRVLAEVSDIALAKSDTLLERFDSYSSFDFFDSLVNATLRNSIRGFVSGHFDRHIAESWQGTSWGAKWLKEVCNRDLESVIMPKYSSDKACWIRAWEWIAKTSPIFYHRPTSSLPALIEKLSYLNYGKWSENVSDFWSIILCRSHNECDPQTNLELCAYALNFAFSHKQFPLGPIVRDSFNTVYSATLSERLPSELGILGFFTYLGWDKGKELRRKLVDSFMDSDWKPGDLALAIRDNSLLRKIFKRIMRRWKGEKYIDRILEDLANRQSETAKIKYNELMSLASNPNFYEPWD